MIINKQRSEEHKKRKTELSNNVQQYFYRGKYRASENEKNIYLKSIGDKWNVLRNISINSLNVSTIYYVVVEEWRFNTQKYTKKKTHTLTPIYELLYENQMSPCFSSH